MNHVVFLHPAAALPGRVVGLNAPEQPGSAGKYCRRPRWFLSRRISLPEHPGTVLELRPHRERSIGGNKALRATSPQRTARPNRGSCWCQTGTVGFFAEAFFFDSFLLLW